MRFLYHVLAIESSLSILTPTEMLQRSEVRACPLASLPASSLHVSCPTHSEKILDRNTEKLILEM